MVKNHQEVSTQEEMVQTALRQRDWTQFSFAKWGRGWAGAWTTITARPLKSSFASVSIAIKIVTHHLWREALENETYWGVKDRDSGEARGIQLRWKPHVPPAQASCEQALATSTGGGNHSPGILTAMAHQWRSLHTAYASINTLNRKTAKSCIKKKNTSFQEYTQRYTFSFMKNPPKCFHYSDLVENCHRQVLVYRSVWDLCSRICGILCRQGLKLTSHYQQKNI